MAQAQLPFMSPSIAQIGGGEDGAPGGRSGGQRGKRSPRAPPGRSPQFDQGGLTGGGASPMSRVLSMRGGAGGASSSATDRLFSFNAEDPSQLLASAYDLPYMRDQQVPQQLSAASPRLAASRKLKKTLSAKQAQKATRSKIIVRRFLHPRARAPRAWLTPALGQPGLPIQSPCKAALSVQGA